MEAQCIETDAFAFHRLARTPSGRTFLLGRAGRRHECLTRTRARAGASEARKGTSSILFPLFWTHSHAHWPRMAQHGLLTAFAASGEGLSD